MEAVEYFSDEDEVGSEGEDEVELGFAEEDDESIFDSLNWEEWDGGQVGGKPVSLHEETFSYTDLIL